MSEPSTLQTQTVALVGHPGVGKTTLYKALIAQGVDGLVFHDLPGTHTLAPNTPAETRVYNLLLGRLAPARGDGLPVQPEPPDAVLVLVDATQLPQQLYLVSQLIDLRLPVVVALNWLNRALDLGLEVRVEALAQQLGVPVIPVEPQRTTGLSKVIAALQEDLNPDQKPKAQYFRPSIGLANAYNHLDTRWISKHLRLHTGARLIEGLRLLATPAALTEYESHPAHKLLARTLNEARSQMEEREENWTLSEVLQRHQWAARISGMVTTQGQPRSLIERVRRRLVATPRWVAWVCLGGAALLFLTLWLM